MAKIMKPDGISGSEAAGVGRCSPRLVGILIALVVTTEAEPPAIGPRGVARCVPFLTLRRANQDRRLQGVTILQAIRAAIEAGRLKEPFTARDVVGALQEHRFSYGSLMSSSAVIAARGRMHPYAGSGAAAIG